MDSINNGTWAFIEGSLDDDGIGGTMAKQEALTGTTNAPSLPPLETLASIKSILANRDGGIMQDSRALQVAWDSLDMMRNWLIEMEIAPADIINQQPESVLIEMYEREQQKLGGGGNYEPGAKGSNKLAFAPQGIVPGMNRANNIGKPIG